MPNEEQWTWDLTLQRIHPYIDGVKHLQRIAELADVELKLVKRAVRELIYHDRVMLLDLFHFQAIYAPTADFVFFVRDAAMLEECCEYVAINSRESPSHRNQAGTEISVSRLSIASIIDLYSALGPGIILHDFVLAHATQLQRIDIRRLVTFGLVKGFLRRIYKYGLAIASSSSTNQQKLSNNSSASANPTRNKARSSEAAAREIDRAWKQAALSSGWATPPSASAAPISEAVTSADQDEDEEAGNEEQERLMSFLDGKHSMDEICVAIRLSEKKVVEKIKGNGWGDIILFNK